MAQNVQGLYRKAVSKHFKSFYANWMPGAERTLGDYGTFEGGIFAKEGNIRDKGIDFKVRVDQSPENHLFCDGGEYDLKLSAGATAEPVGSAKASITLKNNHSVFFQALDARTNEIENKEEVGKQLIAGYQDGTFTWERAWVVITEIVTAGRTVVAVSIESGATFELEAQANVPLSQIMTNAEVDVSFTNTHSVGYHVDGPAMQLLIGVSKIKGWFTDHFKAARALPDTGENLTFDTADDVVVE